MGLLALAGLLLLLHLRLPNTWEAESWAESQRDREEREWRERANEDARGNEEYEERHAQRRQEKEAKEARAKGEQPKGAPLRRAGPIGGLVAALRSCRPWNA